jgi:membrane protease YdiL (CAAX protease family)
MEDTAAISTPSRPRLWRWFVGTISILIAWQVFGAILTIGVARYFGFDLDVLFATDDAGLAQQRELPPWSAAATTLVSFIPFFLATLVAYRFILKRPFKKLLTIHDRYSWRRTWIGFASFAAISLPMGVGDIVLNQESYTWSWDPVAMAPFLVVALTLLPIQTTAEELFFRGWLQQWLDNGKKKQWMIAILGGALFALPHLANPEVSGNDVYFPIISYGAVGFMLAWTTFRDKTLEIAIGAHFANNFLGSILVSTEDSSIPSPSLFTTPDVAWAPAAISAVVIADLYLVDWEMEPESCGLKRLGLSFVAMLAQIDHEWRASSAHCRGVSGGFLGLGVDVLARIFKVHGTEIAH